MTAFKNEYSFDERIAEARKIRSKYPDRIPVIVEPARNTSIFSMGSAKELVIDKKKFLVPDNITMGQFMFILRNRIKLPQEQALFVFVGRNILAQNSEQMSTLYEKYKDDDLFLTCTITVENTFGH